MRVERLLLFPISYFLCSVKLIFLFLNHYKIQNGSNINVSMQIFSLIFSCAEGLHVPGAVRGQSEGELWPWVRGRQCHNSEPPQRRKLEIPHHVEEQETRYVQRWEKTHTHSIPPVLLLFYIFTNLSKATVTVVDIDSSAEEKIVATSQGSATGLNLKENQRIYFGGLPTIGNYRCKDTPVTHSYSHSDTLTQTYIKGFCLYVWYWHTVCVAFKV